MVGNITFLMIFCGFWSVAVNTMDKLQFLILIMVQVFTIPFPLVCNLCKFSPVKFSLVTDLIHCRHGWNFQVIDWTIRKSCQEFPFEFAASSSTHMPSSCCNLSTLSFLCTSAFSSWYRFLSLPFASLFSLIAANVSSDIHFSFFATWLSTPWMYLYIATYDCWQSFWIQLFLWSLQAGQSWYLSRALLGLPHPVQPPVP